MPQREPVIQGLRNWQRRTTWFVLALVLVLFVALGAVFLNPAYHLLFTQKPATIKFSSLRYYMPGDELQLLQDAPFVEAVIASLREEGQSENRKYRILIGATESLPHPTPPFRCSMKVAEGKFDIAGYAFRRRNNWARSAYEPVQAEYPKDRPVSFSVPPCERGDQLLVIVRLTLLEGDQFPEDLAKVSSLQLTE